MILIPIIIAVILLIFFYKRSVPQLSGWRRYLLIFLRSVAIIMVLVLLFNPIIYFIQNILRKPEIIILEDISDSMSQKSGNISKIEALDEFREIIEKELKKYSLKQFDFADGLKGNQTSTNFSKSMLEISKRIDLDNVSGVFLLSDGWFKDDNLKILEGMNLPIFTFDPDFKITEFDLRISKLKYNKTTYRGDLTPIVVNLNSNNFSGKANVELVISNNPVQIKKVDFEFGNFQQLIFEKSFNQTGLQPFEVIIKSDSTNEINVANNKFQGAIQVLDERSKILIISDKLNWDIKFIINSITRNPHWEHIFLLKEQVLKKIKKRVKLQKEIEQTVVLILINNNTLKFSSEEVKIIRKFVKSGGGLFIIGKPINELSEILPAASSRISSTYESTLYFTEDSKQYETFYFKDKTASENIPPVTYYYVKPKVQAKILAQLENEERSPAILYTEFEKGKVLQFAFHNLWKWQLWDSKNYYNNFITNINSWLSQKSSDRFFAFTDKNTYFAGEKIKIRLHAYDETLTPIRDLNAKLIIKNEKNEKVYEGYLIAKADEYYTEIEHIEEGKYSFSIYDERTKLQTEGEFIITRDNPENRDRGFNIPLLSYISEQTDGKILTKSELEKFNFPKAQPKREELKTELPVYRKWYFIALFLISFCLELFFRKRWGLL